MVKPSCYRLLKRNRALLRGEFDPVAFNNGVGEQLFAHFLHALLGRVGIKRVIHIKLDDAANACGFDLLVSQTGERVGHGLALRVKNARFQGDVDNGFHQAGLRKGESRIV